MRTSSGELPRVATIAEHADGAVCVDAAGDVDRQYLAGVHVDHFGSLRMRPS